MSNERTGVDRVLDWIVPIRLSGKWMSVEVERGVKIMLSLILLATIPTHAISKTLEVVSPDAVDSRVWTKFSLYLLCDIIVYVGIVAGVLLLKPFVLELIEIIEEFIKKEFHNFMSSLIDCVGYTQLSNACAKVKSILHDKWHDANEEMVNKYQDLWEDLQIFIAQK